MKALEVFAVLAIAVTLASAIYPDILIRVMTIIVSVNISPLVIQVASLFVIAAGGVAIAHQCFVPKWHRNQKPRK